MDRAGPFSWVRVLGESLRAGPRDDEIAQHRGGVWITGKSSFTTFHLHGSACVLHFEGEGPNAAARLGPFDSVEVIDGAVYVQPGRALLARLDEQNKQWYAYDDGRWWSGLVIRRCARAETPGERSAEHGGDETARPSPGGRA